MRRRNFIGLIGSATVAWPLTARAQQARQVARIGFLGPAPGNVLFTVTYPVFIAELHKLGFTEGQNLVIEHRRMDEGASKAFASATELIHSNVDVVVAFGPELALKAAVAASQTVPIVMIAVNFDPMASGYVRDITRPERNITGLVSRAPTEADRQGPIQVSARLDLATSGAAVETTGLHQRRTPRRERLSWLARARSLRQNNRHGGARFDPSSSDQSAQGWRKDGDPLLGAQQLVLAQKDLNGRVATKEIIPVLFSLLEGSEQPTFRAS
jgi:hypothetical protein